AVPVDGAARDVDAREDRHDAADVVALLARGQAAAAEQVLDLGVVELGHLLEHLADHVRGEVVGPDVDERALAGAADRGTAGGDDHCFRHSTLPITAFRSAPFANHRVDEEGDEQDAGRREPDEGPRVERAHREHGDHQRREIQEAGDLHALDAEVALALRLAHHLARERLVRVEGTEYRVHAAPLQAAQVPFLEWSARHRLERFYDRVSRASRVKRRSTANHAMAPVATRLKVLTASGAQSTALCTIASRRTRTALRIGIR